MGTVTPLPFANRAISQQTGFERPEYRIEKRPALRSRQGMWALVSEAGAVLKRGDELANILAPVERKLMKLVSD